MQGNLKFVSFGRRAAAKMIDMVTLVALQYLMLWPTLFLHALMTVLFVGPITAEEASTSIYTTVAIVVLSISLIYNAGFNSSRRSATPGKLLLRIQVKTDESEQLNFKQAIIRYLSGWISLITGVGVLMAIWNRNNKAMHDLISGTAVLHKDDNRLEDGLGLEKA